MMENIFLCTKCHYSLRDKRSLTKSTSEILNITSSLQNIIILYKKHLQNALKVVVVAVQ